MANTKNVKKGREEKQMKNNSIILFSLLFLSISIFTFISQQTQTRNSPIKFLPGIMANGFDLRGTRIEVTFNEDFTSAEVTLHPTYGVTYYRDILRLKNFDGKPHDIALSVEKPFSEIVQAKIILFKNESKIAELNLLNYTFTDWIEIQPNEELRIDYFFEIRDIDGTGNCTSPPFAFDSAKVKIIVSP